MMPGVPINCASVIFGLLFAHESGNVQGSGLVVLHKSEFSRVPQLDGFSLENQQGVPDRDETG